MNDIAKNVEKLLADLKQERDELRLKVELAKLEANEEWVKLEAKLVKLEGKVRELSGVAGEVSQDVGAAAKILGEEIRDGFRKLAKHL